LTNAFLGVGARGNMELPPIGFVILHYTASLSINMTPDSNLNAVLPLIGAQISSVA
jgi:hypothetical protein